MGLYVYQYDKPASFDGDQLLVEVFKNGRLRPQTFDYGDHKPQVTFGFKTPLTTQEEDTLSNIVSSHVADPYWRAKYRCKFVIKDIPPRSVHTDISYPRGMG